MPLATECYLEGRRISVLRALELTRVRPRPPFSCLECGLPVKPHSEGGGAEAHFEHLARNAKCSLSHRPRIGNGAIRLDYDLDDEGAVEGYRRDRWVLEVQRNRTVVEARKKRDKGTCQACGFVLQVEGRYIIDVHHRELVADAGVREVTVDDLICLCPTCHRISHLRRRPLTVEEIKKVRVVSPR